MNTNATPEKIIAPFTVLGKTVDSRQIANAIDLIANLPAAFSSGGVITALLPAEPDVGVRFEASNRLFQRWRKLGLATSKRKLWTLTPGAWNLMQQAAHEARKDS